MHRITIGLSMLALTAVAALPLLPRHEERRTEGIAMRRPDTSSVGVDYMPVGSTKAMARPARINADHRS